MNEPTKVNVEVERKDKMSRWQWIAVVGIGTFLLPGLVWFFTSMVKSNSAFVQDKLINSLDKNTTATAKAEAASQQVEEAVKDFGDTIEDFSREVRDFARATDEQGKRIDRLLEHQWRNVRETEP